MTIKIYGNANTLAAKNITVNNRNWTVKDIPVNTPSHINRKTLATTLRKYLKVGGGFDRGLWQPPLVAQLPNGKLLLFDGDHRRALWKLAYPNDTTMPAQVVAVKNINEISALFVVINKSGRKSLSADEVFVHEALSGDVDALATEKVLSFCNLSVSLGTGAKGSVAGSAKGIFSKNPVTVRITGFKNTLRQTDKDAVRKASEFLQKVYPSDDSLNHELLAGLSYIFHKCNISNIPKAIASLEDMFKTYGLINPTQNKISGYFKREGGSLVNHDEKCVALGILECLSTDVQRSKLMSKKTFYKYFGSYKKQLIKELK